MGFFGKLFEKKECAICGGEIELTNANIEHLDALISKLANNNCRFWIKKGKIIMQSSKKHKAISKIETMPYPGFPTDLQPLFSTLMAYGMGGAYTDTVFPERFSHLLALSPFGVGFYKVMDRIIVPRIKLRLTASVTAPDLRGGAACLLAALATGGESRILAAEKILRGYERPWEKLSALGADIRLV